MSLEEFTSLRGYSGSATAVNVQDVGTVIIVAAHPRKVAEIFHRLTNQQAAMSRISDVIVCARPGSALESKAESEAAE